VEDQDVQDQESRQEGRQEQNGERHDADGCPGNLQRIDDPASQFHYDL
jgi:hypothetical protein